MKTVSDEFITNLKFVAKLKLTKAKSTMIWLFRLNANASSSAYRFLNAQLVEGR